MVQDNELRKLLDPELNKRAVARLVSSHSADTAITA